MSKFKVGDEIPVSAILRITAIQETNNGNTVYATDRGLHIPECVIEDMRINARTPKEPINSLEPIKLYCVRDNSSLQTKGKTYTLTGGCIQWDDFYEKNTYKDFTDYARRNPNLHKTLVPLVKRPAKVGEWVRISEGTAAGVIGKVLKVFNDSSCLVRHADVWGLWPDSDGMETTRFSGSAYLVLDGYQPEPEYYNGKAVYIAKGSTSLTQGKVYEFTGGVMLDNDGDMRPAGRDPIKSLEDDFTKGKFIAFKGE